jgi:hypothetical protein
MLDGRVIELEIGLERRFPSPELYCATSGWHDDLSTDLGEFQSVLIL